MKTIFQYVNEFGISLTYGFDSDERWIITVSACTDVITKDTVVDNCYSFWSTYLVSTPGVYTVSAVWNDGGVPNYYTGELASTSFILHLWLPETTYHVEPLMQPGHIYQGYSNPTIIDNSTFYEPVHPQTDPNQPPYSIGQWLGAHQIYGGDDGIDFDTRVITTYQENGQTSVQTTVYNNDVQCIGYNQNVYLHQPGVYTVSWTYMDIPNIPEFVDDPDTTRSITLVVFQVEVSQPTTWPKPVAISNTLALQATVTPEAALGGTYTWAQDSGAGTGTFSPNNTSVKTTVFTAGTELGDVYFRVAYTKSGETAYSEPKRIIVFGMSILALSFTGDHTIQCNTTVIVDPVWSIETTPTKNDPIAYNKESNVSMSAKFVVSPNLPVSTSLYLMADDTSEENLDAFKIVSISGDTTVIEGISSTTTLKNKVYIPSLLYQWKYGTDSANWPSTGNTGPHKIYVTLSTPQAPMAIPWTEVLDKSCVWADGVNTDSLAVDSITKGAYWNIGKNYSGLSTHTDGTLFHLKKFLNDNWADCQDMSATLQVFSNVLGVSGIQVRRINGPFLYKNIDPVGSPGWNSDVWNFHQVGWYSDKVYDACLRLNIDEPRVPVNEDIDGSYKEDLFEAGYWDPDTPSSYTEVDANLDY
ncbi:MAG: hypothetical protein QME64_05180 [bacterium]|nr:hypothetical protein [bacterium]